MPLNLEERIELNRYRVMGPPCVVEGQLRHLSKIVDEWRQLGHPDEISQALDDATDLIQRYKKFGTISQIELVYERMAELDHDVNNPLYFTKEEKEAIDLFIQSLPPRVSPKVENNI